MKKHFATVTVQAASEAEADKKAKRIAELVKTKKPKIIKVVAFDQRNNIYTYEIEETV